MSPQNSARQAAGPRDGQTRLGKEHRRCHRLGDDFVGRLLLAHHVPNGAGGTVLGGALANGGEHCLGFGTKFGGAAVLSQGTRVLQRRGPSIQPMRVTSARVGLWGRTFLNSQNLNLGSEQ